MKKIILFLIVLTSLTFGQLSISQLPNTDWVDTADAFLITRTKDLTSRNVHWDILNDYTHTSHPFIPGWQAGYGWRIDSADGEYNLTIDNIYIRGTLFAYQTMLNEIRGTNGNLLVSASAKVDRKGGAWAIGQGLTSFYVDSAATNPFVSGDLIICQRFKAGGAGYDGSGNLINNGSVIKRLIFQVYNTDQYKVDVGTVYGAPGNIGNIEKGDVFVRFGNINPGSGRSGAIGLYSDEENSPYLRVTDSVTSWSAWKSPNSTKLQLGNLKGIVDPDFDELSSNPGYGLYADGSIFLKNGKIAMTGEGYIRSGKKSSGDSVSGFWIGRDDSGVTFNVGNDSSYIRFAGDSLVVKGKIIFNDSASVFDSLNNRIDSLFYLASFTDSLINLKVNKVSFDSLGNIVNTNRSDIQQNASDISMKVDNTAFNTLSGRVDGAYSLIQEETQNRIDADSTFATIINLKASVYSLDTVYSKFDTAISNIRIKAGDNYGELYSLLQGKAGISVYDSINNVKEYAEAGITAKAYSVDSLGQAVTSKLTLYAKRDSIMNYVNITPDMISINGDTYFYPGYDPSKKTDSTKVVSIIDGTVTAPYINALNITADSVIANVSISSPTITGGNFYSTGIISTLTQAQTSDPMSYSFPDGTIISPNRIQLMSHSTSITLSQSGTGDAILSVSGYLAVNNGVNASSYTVSGHALGFPDIAGTVGSFQLPTTGVTARTYNFNPEGLPGYVTSMTIDSKGRITAITVK